MVTKENTTRLAFRRNDEIGALAAEDDAALLARCFLDTGEIDILLDCQSPKTIIVGRTGTGKSAILCQLAQDTEKVIPINAEHLALTYISNSTILSFVLKLGLQLDPFFRLLWRHVFVVEIIRRRFNIVDEMGQRTILDELREIFMKKNHKRALAYFRAWEHSFWQDTDSRVKEVTGKFEEQLENEIKVAVPRFDIRSTDTTKLTEEEKTEVIHRAEHVINELQVHELSEIMDALPDILKDPQRHYYITIDRLDENWVDERIKYLLIRALIETVRDFQRIPNVKIIVAIRTDLIERVLRETRDAGFQEEKYESIYLRLTWSRESLIKLLDIRINEVFKQRYTKQSVSHTDLMRISKTKQNAIGYIIDRTLMRPRDLILLFNECIQQSVDKTNITNKAIHDAEGNYSRKRLTSLGEEWVTCYPKLVDYTKILRQRQAIFKLSDITERECTDLILTNLENDRDTDELSNLALQLYNSKITYQNFLRELMYIFYRIGLVGLKTTGYETYQWALDGRTINSAEMTEDFRVKIHPCFWRVLGITSLQEDEEDS